MSKNNPLIIYLSFKANDISDIELYNWICKNNYKSAFIKSILRQAMKKELSKNIENYTKISLSNKRQT